MSGAEWVSFLWPWVSLHIFVLYVRLQCPNLFDMVVFQSTVKQAIFFNHIF
jgi:hypothetical protein